MSIEKLNIIVTSSTEGVASSQPSLELLPVDYSDKAIKSESNISGVLVASQNSQSEIQPLLSLRKSDNQEEVIILQ